MSKFQIGALAMAIVAGTAWAQEENSLTDGTATTWRESAIARCAQQYSAEQCQDEEFLEANFHVTSLGIAHRAATRRNRQAQQAMHELILQRACNVSPSKVCNDSTQCIAEITNTCATLKAEAARCMQHAKAGCATTANPSSCYKQQVAQCPSAKKMPIEQLLAKYPKLSASQKSRLTATAAQLDAKTSGWWSNLVDWLKTPFS